MAARLSAQPDVDYAQARIWAGPSTSRTIRSYSRQWNFPAIDMERAWDINTGGSSAITVAVLDTGVAYRSGVLRQNAIAWTARTARPGSRHSAR